MAKKTVSILTGKRLLVLDDEFLIGLDIESILEQAGAEVVMFNEVETALTALREGERFEAGVLDLKIGGQSSLSVAAVLAERETPFIFLTGTSGGGVHTQQFPAVPVVVKPFDDKRLLAALETILAGRPR